MAKQTNRIADNIDIQVEIMPVPFEELSARATGETSADIRARVVRAREIQAARFADEPEVHCNAQMGPRHIAAHCVLTPDCAAILRKAMLKYDMSARAYTVSSRLPARRPISTPPPPFCPVISPRPSPTAISTKAPGAQYSYRARKLPRHESPRRRYRKF